MIDMLMINMMIISTFFMMVNHPLSMMMILIIYTINICMLMGVINKTFWFSYILFLIMLGGMMILFMYMTNLVPNEFLKINLKKTLFLTFLSLLSYMFFQFINDYDMFDDVDDNNYEMIMMEINNESMNYTNKIFNKYTNMISILLISYLFISLIAIVKMINIKMGPLRINN
uniref:NADH-ubiquinone oxidoreductase chain 6 n=1 Tax=Chinolyda flagellicornis TaxID=2492400 RepID=A0A3G8FWH8_9HYME|nr:NADH dehydrogenase subunit 6 [Chinolyda flagellicornis]